MESFFDDIVMLVEGAERQYGVANARYTEYVLERFEFCISTCTLMYDRMEQNGSGLEDYTLSLSELIECLRVIYNKWMEYEGVIERLPASSTAYRAPTLISRGRPRFDISKEQLVYLSSLYFTWVDIAALLGVSRMTVYRFVFNDFVCGVVLAIY